MNDKRKPRGKSAKIERQLLCDSEEDMFAESLTNLRMDIQKLRTKFTSLSGADGTDQGGCQRSPPGSIITKENSNPNLSKSSRKILVQAKVHQPPQNSSDSQSTPSPPIPSPLSNFGPYGSAENVEDVKKKKKNRKLDQVTRSNSIS